ncbi:MAG: trimethylamine---corrinoid protein Co-methyltransferase [Eubacteriaceae bacterium]|nr:trimethylamine---corrinoid protein Co-methyltransferase [Eubacteriaceae bacterium]
MRLKYSFMSIKEQKQIHESTLSLLNSTGVMVHSEKAHDIFKHHGARSDGKKIFIPEHRADLFYAPLRCYLCTKKQAKNSRNRHRL